MKKRKRSLIQPRSSALRRFLSFFRGRESSGRELEVSRARDGTKRSFKGKGLAARVSMSRGHKKNAGREAARGLQRCS